MVNEIMNFIAQHDPEVGKAIEAEYARQKRNIELIASENIVSEAVMAFAKNAIKNGDGCEGQKFSFGFMNVNPFFHTPAEKQSDLARVTSKSKTKVI